MKKQILNIGKALNRAEQKKVFGGSMYDEDEGGLCQVLYPEQPAGCACNKNSQCASGKCGSKHGGYFKKCD